MSVAAFLACPCAAAAAGPEPTLELPIREVSVFSDRARVVRRGNVTLPSGQQRVRLPVLPATIDPDSLRLEAEGGSVLRVDLRRAGQGEFPRSEAERLVAELEQADDVMKALNDRHRTLTEERQLLLEVRPEAGQPAESTAPPRLLDPSGWKTGLAFVESRVKAIDEAMQALEAQRRSHAERTAQLAARASQLALTDNADPGWVVEAMLDAKSPLRLSLTYLAANARWRPVYDVRFTPGTPEVEVAFGGLVSQETGEDWTEAQLSLSTAVPATTATLPKLAS